VKILERLQLDHGNAELIRYLDGSIGIRVNNVTWATEVDNCAYYANSTEYNQRQHLFPQVWLTLRGEENEMVRTQKAS